MIINFSNIGTSGGGSGSGTTYRAGEYIDITSDVISVTGITPDDYLTSADTEDFVTSGDVKTQIEAYDYWTSAETQSAITEAYDSATTHIDEVEQIMSSALNEFHTQIMDLSGETLSTKNSVSSLTNDYSFISGRVQTNETVLANAVNDIVNIKSGMSNYYTSAQTNTAIDNAIASESARSESAYVKSADLTAYTPTTGFSTINGSAITNGGNIVISGVSTYTLPVATDSTLGGIIKGSYLQIDTAGTLSVDAEDLRYNSGVFDINEADWANKAGQLKQASLDEQIAALDEYYSDGDKRAILGTFYPMSGIVTFNTSDVETNLSDGDECFGLSDSVDYGNFHLHLYYSNDGEGNISYAFDDDDATEVDLTTDGTSAYTLTQGYDPNDTSTIPYAYTYYVTVTVDNGDVTMVFTLSGPEKGGALGIQMWGTYTNLETDEPVFYVNTPEGGIQMLAHTEGKTVIDEYDNEYDVRRWVKYVNEDNIKDFGLVQSNSISNMWKGTQAEYDTLTQSGATADPNTFYIILPSA